MSQPNTLPVPGPNSRDGLRLRLRAAEQREQRLIQERTALLDRLNAAEPRIAQLEKQVAGARK